MAAENDQEQRRRVDGAVVRRLRDLAHPRELADPQLVEDLAGLLVAPRVLAATLPAGEQPKRLSGDIRIPRQRLQRRDQRIPPEQRREPRNARLVIPEAVELAAQLREIVE